MANQQKVHSWPVRSYEDEDGVLKDWVEERVHVALVDRYNGLIEQLDALRDMVYPPSESEPWPVERQQAIYEALNPATESPGQSAARPLNGERAAGDEPVGDSVSASGVPSRQEGGADTPPSTSSPASTPSIYEGTPKPHGLDCRCADCLPASRPSE